MQNNGTTHGDRIAGHANPGNSSSGNRAKLEQLQAGWANLLAQATQLGFYGSVAIELAVQDGTIQNIRQKVERLDR